MTIKKGLRIIGHGILKYQQKGWRAHMSNVHAAIGIAQFEIMNKNFEKRKKLAKYYSDKLSLLSPHLDIVEISDEHVPHILPIILNKG